MAWIKTCINLNILECKVLKYSCGIMEVCCINLNILECKDWNHYFHRLYYRRINLNILECKDIKKKTGTSFYDVLI